MGFTDETVLVWHYAQSRAAETIWPEGHPEENLRVHCPRPLCNRLSWWRWTAAFSRLAPESDTRRRKEGIKAMYYSVILKYIVLLSTFTGNWNVTEGGTWWISAPRCTRCIRCSVSWWPDCRTTTPEDPSGYQHLLTWWRFQDLAACDLSPLLSDTRLVVYPCTWCQTVVRWTKELTFWRTGGAVVKKNVLSTLQRIHGTQCDFGQEH